MASTLKTHTSEGDIPYRQYNGYDLCVAVELIEIDNKKYVKRDAHGLYIPQRVDGMLAYALPCGKFKIWDHHHGIWI